MEKKITTISALCFVMIGATAVMGILIENPMLKRVAVICGCLVVVWMTTLNFKALKHMRAQVEAETPVIPDVIHWLQGETWPEILSPEKVQVQFPKELETFMIEHPDRRESNIKGYRIWRSEETENYFASCPPGREQILVLYDMALQDFQVFGSKELQQAMKERA